jgi:hypothetical protein
MSRLSLSQIMANFDMVLKCWGPVEADYNKHGGLVLSRSVDNIGLYFVLAQGDTFFLLILRHISKMHEMPWTRARLY